MLFAAVSPSLTSFLSYGFARPTSCAVVWWQQQEEVEGGVVVAEVLTFIFLICFTLLLLNLLIAM